MTRPIAVGVTDIHCSHNPPKARKTDDWYGAMRSVFLKLSKIRKKYKVPILCMGDLFHTWDEPAELINFLLKYIPDEFYAIPGQHDLRDHSYEDIEKTAYWTLVKAGRVHNVEPGKPIDVGSVTLHGFPWGSKLLPTIGSKGRFNIAMVHKYVWDGHAKFAGAGAEDHVLPLLQTMTGYDMILTGDNHKQFEVNGQEGTLLVNCGCALPRKTDERNFKPRMVLLFKDGSVRYIKLDQSKVKWVDHTESLKNLEEVIDIEPLLDKLGKLASKGIDYLKILRKAAENKNVSKRAKELIAELLRDIE